MSVGTSTKSDSLVTLNFTMAGNNCTRNTVFWSTEYYTVFLALLIARHESLADLRVLQVLVRGIQSKTTNPFLKDSWSRGRLLYICAWWDYIKPDGLSSRAFFHLFEEE